MYNTGNQVPSSALEDMADNAQVFDGLVTKTSGTVTDRFGNVRRPFQQIVTDMGFNPVTGSFQSGATVTEYNQCLLDSSTGAFYSWNGALPKVVPAGSTPAKSGGIGALLWVDRTDLALRSDINIIKKRFECLADAVSDLSLTIGQIISTFDYYTGSLSVIRHTLGGNSYIVVPGGTGTPDRGLYINLANGLQLKGLFPSGGVRVEQFGAKGDGSTDDTSAIQNAINSGGNGTGYNVGINGLKVMLSDRVYKVTNLTMKSGVSLVGEGRQVSRLKAVGTSGWTISTTPFVGGTRSFETSLKGFSVNGNPSMGVISDPLVTRPSVGGLGLYSSIGLRVDDVSVYFLDGVAIGNYTNQDVGFTNIDILHCRKGVDFGRYDNDIDNALHFFGLRVENCDDYLINISGGASQVRDINFTASKFEHGYIFIKECSGVMFSACSIIPQVAGVYMVQVSTGASSDTRCVTFDGCFFTSALNKQARAISAKTGTNPIIVNGCSITALASEAFNGDILLTNNTLYDITAPYALLSAKGNSYGNKEYAVNRVAVTASESGGVTSSIHYAADIAVSNLYDYTNGAYVAPSAVVHNNIYKNMDGDDIIITAKVRNLLSNSAAAAIQVLVGPTTGLSRALGVLSMPGTAVRDYTITFRVKAGWYFRIVASAPSVADVSGVVVS